MIKVLTKNKAGMKLDDVMETLSDKRRRFYYAEDISDNSYVVVLSSLPYCGSSFFEMKDAGDMYRTIYDIMGEVQGNAYKNINKKYSFLERLYDPSMDTTSAVILSNFSDFPRINFGTGKQFKHSLQNGLF